MQNKMGDNLILDLATDYSDYLKVDFKKEIGSLEEVIEDTLTRLEEFESVVDMLRTNCDVELVTRVLSRSEELRSLFIGIRKLEALVSLIRLDVEQAEAQLNEAEATTKGSDGKFRSLLKPLFFKKPSLEASTSRSVRTPSYEAPHLFTTANFFPDHHTETT